MKIARTAALVSAMATVSLGGGHAVASAPAGTDPAPAANTNLFASECKTAMKQGERNNCVSRLQKLLNDKNDAGIKVDGLYASSTTSAVKAWQKAKGLTQDGVTGAQTKRTLEGNNRAIAYWTDQVDADTSPGSPKYVFGAGHGSSPGPTGNGIDCSGFTRWVAAKAFGKDTLGAHDTISQYDQLEKVSSANRQPGDLVFFWGERDGVERIVHVGVYWGGDKVTHSWGGTQNGIQRTDLKPVEDHYAQYSNKGVEYARF